MKTFAVAGAPHLPAANSVRRMMAAVLVALLPGIALQVVWFGPGLLLQLALATVFAVLVEAAALRLRRQPVRVALEDLSAVVTAVLFALCVPPLCPWWISALGMLVAIGLVKHAYGGIGCNLFNPAMAAYALLLLLYPPVLAQWPAAVPDLAETVRAIAFGRPPALWDTLASATPLDALRQLSAQGYRVTEMAVQPLYDHAAVTAWYSVAAAYALGGIYLLARRVISWQVPAGVIGGCLLLTLPLWLYDGEQYLAPWQHLGQGGLMLAAWIIANDPVSGCAAPRGRLLFGFGVAALTLLLRSGGDQPDGVAFAVLLMNAAAPLIDRLTRPRIHGHGRHD